MLQRGERKRGRRLWADIFVKSTFKAYLAWSEYLMFPLWASTATAAGTAGRCPDLLQ